MGVRFVTSEGRQGTLDVAKLAAQELKGVVTGVKDGIIHVKTDDGSVHGFSIADWAERNQATIVSIDGFNSPDTALDSPPIGMNHLDQSIFYQDGKDMGALTDLYPKNMERSDGRVVVLDSDGLWKTMWSPYIKAPQPPSSFMEKVERNEAQDPKFTMRTAGIIFMMALANKKGAMAQKGFKISDVIESFRIIGRNTPTENKLAIGKLMNQTTGLDQFKFYNAILDPDSTKFWLERALKLTSFQFRMLQSDMAQEVVEGMHTVYKEQFDTVMQELVKLEETKRLRVNLKQLTSEFIQFLVGLNLLRDISRTTGLDEWIALNEDQAYDQSKLPELPKFVEAFVQLLRWLMPIASNSALGFATGRTGLKAIIGLMVMIDDCIFSLAGVPDHSAKYKMFMALKRLQAAIETKLSFHYQPSPEENPDGLKENPFMQIKSFYNDKRESVYKICQLPVPSWNNTLLDLLRESENPELFYDTLPPSLAKAIKSFASMDAAYDIQPWVDITHAERTHDPFSQYNESFGLVPPEAGYLAKNSPRAAFNIAETLIEGATFMMEMGKENLTAMMRSPWLLNNMVKSLMVASVNRELGTVEVLSKFGVDRDMDQMASPDASRIWEDPEDVQRDIDYQIQEIMGGMAMEQAMMAQQQQQKGAQEAQAQEQVRDGGQGEQAGPGPMGRPMAS